MNYHTRCQFHVARKDIEIWGAERVCYNMIAKQLIDLNAKSYTVHYTISIIPHEYHEELNYVQIDAEIRVNDEAR